MKPTFAAVEQGYPRLSEFPLSKLYETLGWESLADLPQWRNTCATRMSIALARAGVVVPGRMRVKKGVLNGIPIEPGQGKLSQILKRLWGQPEVFKDKVSAAKGVGQRNGVISFFRIQGPQDTQGHIDIIYSGSRLHECAMSCYFSAAEIWFWELK